MTKNATSLTFSFCGIILFSSSTAFASHHLSGPDLKSPLEDARLDLSDLFAFTAPDGERTVLIMNANPDFGGQGDAFHPDAIYRINVDTDNDLLADIAYSFVFSEPENGEQTATVYRTTGEKARAHESKGKKIFKNVLISFSSEPQIFEKKSRKLFIGRRSDPFFADIEGIGAGFEWTGRDTMANMNIFSIVLELPHDELGENATIGVWSRVSLYQDGELVSIDRGAHPSLTAYFNQTTEATNAYNRGEPATDWDTYSKPWSDVLAHTGGYSAEDAEKTLHTVLPDVLRYNRAEPAAYPNGRSLIDDVTDVRLKMISNGNIQGDNISSHADLLDEFPYLGSPHQK